MEGMGGEGGREGDNGGKEEVQVGFLLWGGGGGGIQGIHPLLENILFPLGDFKVPVYE